MKYPFIILFAILAFPLFSQTDCCENMEENTRKMYAHFKTVYNTDSSNYCLAVIDPESTQPIYKYCYQEEYPILNLRGDRFHKDYLKKTFKGSQMGYIQSIPRARDSSIVLENSMLRRSQYRFKCFDIDTISPLIKTLIHEWEFPYCNDNLAMKVNSKTIFLQQNKLEYTLTNKYDFSPIHYALIHNYTSLSSCVGNQQFRKLSIISSDGKPYTINEKYALREKIKFSHGFVGINSSHFDIIRNGTQLFFTTYVEGIINIYDLNSEQLIVKIDSIGNGIYQSNGFMLNKQAIIFIPKPLRIGGYDIKKHRGFKGNHIDFSRIKDYDESEKLIIVYDLSEGSVYYKKYRIDQIEKITGFDGFNIIFENDTEVNIKTEFEVKTE